jgi:glucosyl-dolichyl phosphate glucuronosyltransferase
VDRTTVDSRRSRERVGPSVQASVIVCAYTEERRPQIRMAPDSIARQTVAPQKVIAVIDHNPALCGHLEEECPKIEVIPDKFKRGLSGERNTGIQRASGDIAVFLDDDARAEPGWLESPLAPYDDESVLGVSGLVLADWGSKVRPGWRPEEFSGSWDAAIADCPRPKRRSTIPWARSRRGALGEALA